MTEREKSSNESLESRIANDLRALREATGRDLPTLPSAVAPFRTRPPRGPQWKELLVTTIHSTTRRPWLSAGLAAAAIALIGLVVPISYERTTGHQVSVVVTDPAAEQVTGIANELKSALGATSMSVNAEGGAHGTNFTFTTTVPASRDVDAASVAQAFARELEARGFRAAATTTPVRERVSGNVYAYARDRVIRVETSGKSAAQIEAEIREQIAAAGLTGTKVSVTDEGGRRKVHVVQHADAAPTSGAEPENLKLELTKDGQPLSAGDPDGISVAVERKRTANGETLHLDVKSGAQSASIDIPNVSGMNDATLAEAVRAELAKHGLDLKVSVESGRFSFEKP